MLVVQPLEHKWPRPMAQPVASGGITNTKFVLDVAAPFSVDPRLAHASLAQTLYWLQLASLLAVVDVSVDTKICDSPCHPIALFEQPWNRELAELVLLQ